MGITHFGVSSSQTRGTCWDMVLTRWIFESSWDSLIFQHGLGSRTDNPMSFNMGLSENKGPLNCWDSEKGLCPLNIVGKWHAFPLFFSRGCQV